MPFRAAARTAGIRASRGRLEANVAHVSSPCEAATSSADLAALTVQVLLDEVCLVPGSPMVRVESAPVRRFAPRTLDYYY